MNITIYIDRGQDYGKDTEEGKKAKEIFKSLIATEFPMGIMQTMPNESVENLSYSGPITDFVEAITIKRKYIIRGQRPEDKKEMNAKLMPIYQKSRKRMTT